MRRLILRLSVGVIPAVCPILRPESIATMFARPAGPAGYDAGGTPKEVYYGCGWQVCPIGPQGHADTWHFGRLDGTSALLTRRYDGKNCAVLFNTSDGPDGQPLASKIAGLLHQAVDQVHSWPRQISSPNGCEVEQDNGGRRRVFWCVREPAVMWREDGMKAVLPGRA